MEPNKYEECNKPWLSSRIKDMKLDKTPCNGEFLVCNDSWGYDQSITTYGILKHRLCTLPKNNGLWRIPGLVEKQIHFPEMDDSNVCWHGKHYTDCNIERQHMTEGCKWWHFFPHDNLAVHVKKFKELTKGIYNSRISNLYFNLRNIHV